MRLFKTVVVGAMAVGMACSGLTGVASATEIPVGATPSAGTVSPDGVSFYCILFPNAPICKKNA